jgi:hypothetical protein
VGEKGKGERRKRKVQERIFEVIMTKTSKFDENNNPCIEEIH